MSDNLVSRRNFLKKTAMLSAGLAAAGGLAACQPKVAGETPKGEETTFDKEVDVVVVGSGTVIFAALAAKDAGAESVVVLEKNVAFGGTSAISGGGFWIPMNYRMAEEGIEDNREDAYKYLTAVSEGHSDDTLINAYLDNAPKMLEWSRDKLGLKWYNNMEAQGNKNYQDYYELPGFRPFGRTVYFSKGEEPYAYGMPWQILRTTAEEMGIEIMMETTAKDLVTNEAGEVIGVRAEGASGPITIKAKKGVILGTGGFDFNKEMATAFLRTPIFASNAVATNTGDGHKMGMKVGADLRNMQSYWGLPFYVPEEGSMQGEG